MGVGRGICLEFGTAMPNQRIESEKRLWKQDLETLLKIPEEK